MGVNVIGVPLPGGVTGWGENELPPHPASRVANVKAISDRKTHPLRDGKVIRHLVLLCKNSSLALATVSAPAASKAAETLAILPSRLPSAGSYPMAALHYVRPSYLVRNTSLRGNFSNNDPS